LICKLFKCYGISVKTDSSKDNIIFNYNNLTNKNQENELLDETDENNNNEDNCNNKIKYNNWNDLNFI